MIASQITNFAILWSITTLGTLFSKLFYYIVYVYVIVRDFGMKPLNFASLLTLHFFPDFLEFMTQLFSVFQSGQFRIWETSLPPSYSYGKKADQQMAFIFCFCLLLVCFRNISFLNHRNAIYHSHYYHHHWKAFC